MTLMPLSESEVSSSAPGYVDALIEAVTNPSPTGPSIESELGDAVADEASFFQASQMVDALRDCAQELLVHSPVSNAAVAEMVVRYGALRDDAVALVAEKYRHQAEKWVPALDKDADLHQVVFAAVALARWIDSVHALPMHLMATAVQAAGIGDAKEKLAKRGKDAIDEDIGPGAYL